MIVCGRAVTRRVLSHPHMACVITGCNATFYQRASYVAVTATLWKDLRRNDRGESRRLTFEERAERRTGKSKEQRESKEHLRQEAEMIAQQDFPEELESEAAKALERAGMCSMKVLNMAKCLELLDVEVSGGHSVLLTKIAQVLKVSSTTIEVTPNSNAIGNAILQRLSRFDTTLQVSKVGPKVRVVIPPVTTARRDKAVTEIASITTTFRQKAKHSRTHVGRILQDVGLDESVLNELLQEIDSTMATTVEETVLKLEQVAEEVMSMGSDESDEGVQ